MVRLWYSRRGGEAVTQGSAKPPCTGSIPVRASQHFRRIVDMAREKEGWVEDTKRWGKHVALVGGIIFLIALAAAL